MIGAGLAAQSAQAQTYTWIGGGGNWSTPANWSGGNVPPVNSSADTIEFSAPNGGGAANAFNDLSGLNVGALSFPVGNLEQINLLQNAITLGAGGINATTSSKVGIANNIVLNGDQTWSGVVSGANALAITGTISGSSNLTISGTEVSLGADNNTYTGLTTVSNGTQLTLSSSGSVAGNIVNNGTLAFANNVNKTYTGNISGSGALSKSGTNNTLTLTGTNTYTGDTTLAARTGTLQIGNGGTSGSVAGNIVLQGATVGFGATVAFNRSNAVTYGGVISGTFGKLTQAGSGTLTLTGANTYGGATTVSAGTLAIGGSKSGSGAITINPGATLQIGTGGSTGSVAGAITNNGTLAFKRSDDLTYATALTGSGGLTQAGTGTLTLSGANSYTGATTVSNGGLVVNGSTSSASAVAVAAGATLGGSGTVGGATTLNGGTIGSTGDTLTLSSTLGSTGSSTVAAGSTVNVTGGTTVSAGTLDVNGTLGGALAVAGTLAGTGTITGDTSITGIHNPGNSPGIQTFASNLTYTGGASVVNWELKANTTTNAANPNAIFDTIVVGGNLDFAGATSLNLSFTPTGSSVLWSDAFWSSSKSGSNGWLLYDVTGSVSNFGNLSLTAFNWLDSGTNGFATALPGARFSLYQSGSQIYLDYIAATTGGGGGSSVPEPSTFALFGLGALLLRRRLGKAAA